MRIVAGRDVADLNQPFRLTRNFWAAYLLLGVPVLWLSRPWSWELPLLSQLAGIVFLPFAAAIVCYCPFLFLIAISRDKKTGLAFMAAIISATCLLLAVWASQGFNTVPSAFAVSAVVLANLVFAFMQARGSARMDAAREAGPQQYVLRNK